MKFVKDAITKNDLKLELTKKESLTIREHEIKIQELIT